MLFDLTNTRHDTPMKTIKIDLTSSAGFGVRGEKADDLWPEDNPHTVSETFGRELIQGGRAVEHDPDNPIKPAKKVEAPTGVQSRDPKATNRDPK